MKYIGSSITGLLDPRLACGQGTYTADVQLEGMLHLAVVRSPYANALIKGIRTEAARAVAGVVWVATGEELRTNTRALPGEHSALSATGKGYQGYALCPERVRYVGEPVAAVVAEDRHAANQAADLVEVDYQELPAVIDAEEAMKPGAPLVEPSWGENVTMRREVRAGDVGRALAEADGTLSGCIRVHRHTAVPIEPRAYVAAYDRARELLTLWATTQHPHQLRLFIAETLGIAEANVRVIQPNIGGAFGCKSPLFQEEPLVAYLARKLGRPVKWVEQRWESLMAGGHAREMRLYYEAGYKKDGTVTGLKVRIIADIGAPASLAGWLMPHVTVLCIPTLYKIPNCHVELFPVVTNKCPWNAYRGFGKESASFLMERVMDRVADAAGLDPAEVRLKNFIQPDEFPFTQVSGALLDSGNYPKALGRLLEMIDYRNFTRRREEARREGRFIGVGVGMELVPEGLCMDSNLYSGYDAATVKINHSGQVTVLTGVTSPGSGNETGIAQIVADTLGADIREVRVVQGDTELCPFGLGNYSSRSILIGGAAAHTAALELREKLFKVAGRMLEVTPAELEAEGGKIYPKGSPDHSVTIHEVVTTIYRRPFGPHTVDVEPGLEVTRYFRPPIFFSDDPNAPRSAYPSWTYAAVGFVVEVDPETGLVKVLRACIVHDSGVLINPLLAEGNLHGGLAQGLGGALYEHLVYDENGQLTTATLMDYTLPTAVEVPRFEVEHQITPSPFNPLGAKGVGESGVTVVFGALCGAVENALPDFKLNLCETPLTPNRVWQAIHSARLEGRVLR